jgi:type VI secretion system secreted protein VgrG
MYDITVGAEMVTSVALDQTEIVGMSKSVDVVNSLKVSAGEVLELTCGSGSIKMNKDGKVTITGTEFVFAASGQVNISGKDVDLN